MYKKVTGCYESPGMKLNLIANNEVCEWIKVVIPYVIVSMDKRKEISYQVILIITDLSTREQQQHNATLSRDKATWKTDVLCELLI